MSDSHDTDGLSEFAQECDDTWEPATVGADGDHEDWLSAFASESLVEAAPAVLASADGELSPFPSDEHLHHSSDVQYPFLDQFPHAEPAVIPRWQSSIAPWAAALVAGAISVLWGVPALDRAWNAGREDARLSIASAEQSTAVSASLSSSALSPAPRPSTPGVEPGIPSQMLRHFDAVPTGIPPFAIANARFHRQASDTAPAAGRMPTPRTSGSSNARTQTGRSPGAPPRPTVLSAQRADRASAVDTVPLSRVVVASGAGEELLPETQRTPLLADAAFEPWATPAGSEAAVQERAVRRTLHSYEQAYEGLDVAATAAVWPSVDRRALARAFDTLKSQGLDFESCTITVADASATARCRGTLQFVRKVGNSMPLTAEQEWVFKMRRLGADWKIDHVAASQAPGLGAQRIRSQG